MEFILCHQNPNGGWGESYLACVNKSYPADSTGNKFGQDGSGVVQTAWALLGLLAAAEDAGAGGDAYLQPHVLLAVQRGVRFLLSRQEHTGDWPQENISGVFNRSCGITYTQYRNVFSIWALGRYSRLFEQE